MEDNIQVVEEAIFLNLTPSFRRSSTGRSKRSKKNSTEIKRQKNILDDLVQDIRNTADDIEVAKKNKPKTKGKKKTTSEASEVVKSEVV